jgi:hypothetical protein
MREFILRLFGRKNIPANLYTVKDISGNDIGVDDWFVIYGCHPENAFQVSELRKSPVLNIRFKGYNGYTWINASSVSKLSEKEAMYHLLKVDQ